MSDTRAVLPEESKQDKESKSSPKPTTVTNPDTTTSDISEEPFPIFSIYNPRTWSPLHIFLFCLAYRVGIALICRTTFVPDEYYQSVEVAYSTVFNRGITTWEWKGEHAIRSYLYVLPYIILFHFGKLLGITQTWFYSTAPRVLTAINVAGADLLLYLLALRIASPDVTYARLAKRGSTANLVALTSLGIYLTSWSSLYMGVRTYANTWESIYLIASMYFLETSIGRSNERGKHIDYTAVNLLNKWRETFAVCLMVVSVWARPTVACYYIAIVCIRMYQLGIKRFLWQNTYFALISFLSCFLVDTLCYGKVVVPCVNFYVKNVLHGYAGLFGNEGCFWNFKSGVPQMLGAFLPLAIYSLYTMVGYDGRLDSTHGKSMEVMAGDRNFHEPLRLLSFSTFIAVAIQSIVSPHHELRFLQPMMVAWSLIIGHVIGFELARICGNHSMGTLRKAKLLSYMALIPAILHVLVGVYLLTRHQSGTEAAFRHIQQQILSKPLAWGEPGGFYRRVNIHLFAQCHSFPGYSHLHASTWEYNHSNTMAHIEPRIHMYDCSPYDDPKIPGTMTTDATESSRFEDNPKQFARDLQAKLGFFRPHRTPGLSLSREFKAPDVIVTFDCFQKEIESTFASVLESTEDTEQLNLKKKEHDMQCEDGNIEACVKLQEAEVREKQFRSNKLKLVATFAHADMRYDYDDDHVKRKVLVYSRL